jgi:hypothetical protein
LGCSLTIFFVITEAGPHFWRLLTAELHCCANSTMAQRVPAGQPFQLPISATSFVDFANLAKELRGLTVSEATGR